MKQGIPLVSIIFPIFNVENSISLSLTSALKQSYEDIEFLLIDDCGKDKSMDIAYSLIEQFPNRKCRIICHERNKGLSAARNTGIKDARGKYVFFMDSDDIITPDCIKLLVDSAETSGACFSDCNIEIIGGSKWLFKHYNDSVITGQEKILKSFFNNQIHVSAWNKLVDLDWLLKKSLFFVEGILYEDMNWTMRLCEHANTVALVSNVGYKYIIRTGSITHSALNRDKVIKQLNSVKCILDETIVIINSKHGPERNAGRKWMSGLIFKHCCRVSAEVDDKALARFFYNEITQTKYRKWCVLPYSPFFYLGFGMFSMLFRRPYIMYKRNSVL